MKNAQLAIVPEVTHEHGNAFAQRWFEESQATGAIYEACHSLELTAWPVDEETQEHVNRVEDEICELTFDAVKPLISAAFVKAAAEVLARERRYR